jgi:type IV pilus assembly protein PilB
VPDDAVKAVPGQLAFRLSVMPIDLKGRHLRVALADPFNFDAIDTLSKELRYDIDPVVSPQDQIDQALKRHYGNTEEQLSGSGRWSGDRHCESRAREMKKVPAQSCRRRAHHPPGQLDDPRRAPAQGFGYSSRAAGKALRLRYRIDGVLQVMPDQQKKLQGAIVSRLKIMSNLSIAEKRLPQDGRIQMRSSDGKTAIDLRVSTIPTNHGESIVMRILDKTSLQLGLTELGYLSDDQATMERIMAFADGIFLVTGPTGSGKSTTLYACLNIINKPDRKIITVEDPVEYQLNGHQPGAGQCRHRHDLPRRAARHVAPGAQHHHGR